MTGIEMAPARMAGGPYGYGASDQEALFSNPTHLTVVAGRGMTWPRLLGCEVPEPGMEVQARRNATLRQPFTDLHGALTAEQVGEATGFPASDRQLFAVLWYDTRMYPPYSSTSAGAICASDTARPT